MVATRLQEIGIRKKDFAENYLHISRPTLDKFLHAYDFEGAKGVNARVRKIFDFITENPEAGQRSVLAFIAKMNEEELPKPSQPPPEGMEEPEALAGVRRFMEANPTSSKSEFFALAARTGDFDDVIRYLLKIKLLLRERRLTEEQIALLEPYDDIRAIMEKQDTMED